MSSVDDRIVNMQFNNKQFLSGATDSQKALEGLERTMANTAKGKGLDDMGRGVDAISTRFSALQVAGISALATIASKATTVGLNLVKGLTLDPIKQGFDEYELNLKSIQTVVANTGLGVGEVGKYMQQLNKYSDQTVYNFSQMAQNIGRFTAAGVDVDVATDAIKGMANAAALAGADTNQLNSAMYQMSQALSSGTIRLMDWNSLVNANMGGENIQEALKATAKTMDDHGAAMEAAIAKNGNFRDSLQEGWLEADIYTKTMKVMAGQVEKGTGKTIAFSVAQLQAMGYTKKSAEELNKLSAASIDSATKIKTFTQLLDVVKESIGSGWARIFRGLFGGLNKASDLWTGVGEKITGAMNTMFSSLSQVLRGWRQAGGYEAMWNGFGNIFQTIGNLLKPFVALFQAIFPATQDVGGGLANASKGFESVTAWIEKLTSNTSYLIPAFTKAGEAIRWVFDNLGALISVGAKVVTILGGLAAQGAEIAGNIIGGLVEGLDGSALFAKVVDLANNIVSWIEGALGIASPATELVPVGKNIALGIAKGLGDGIIFIIESMGTLLPKLIAFGGEVVAALAVAIFKSVTALFTTVLDVIAKIAPALGDALSTIGGATADSLSSAGEHTGSVWENVGKVFAFLGAGIMNVMGGLGDAVGWVMEKFLGLFNSGGGDALNWAALLNTVLVGGVLLTIRKFMKGITSFTGIADDLRGIFQSVAGAIGDFGDALKRRSQAELIRSVAIAIGILAVSLLVLSFIDVDKLGKGLGAIATMLALLGGMMFALSKIDGSFDMVKMAGAMILMSTAVLILSAAVAILGNMDNETLARGLAGIAVSLGLLVGAMFLFSKIKGSIAGMAASMLIMGVALNAIALAVAAFGNMDAETLKQGLAGIAVSLGLLVGAMFLLGKIKNVEGSAASILVLSGAMVVLSIAVAAFGAMDPAKLAIGMTAMAVGLALMVGAVMLLSGNSAGALAGAAAILIISVAMTKLMIVILALGVAPWEVVARGIGFFAAALAVLLLAALGAQFVAVGLIALGATVALLGAGMLLAGVGMLAFSTGLALLVSLGAAGIAVMIAAISAFIALLPSIAIQVAASFVAFIETIAAAAPRIRDAFSKIFEELLGVVSDAVPQIAALISTIFDAILDIIIKAIPRIGELMSTLLDTMLDVVIKAVPKFGKLLEVMIETGIGVLRESIPRWIELGFTLIDRFLESVERHVPKIVGTVADIITTFIETLTDRLPKIIRAGTDLIIAFIDGIADNTLRLANAAARTLIDFLNGIATAIDTHSKGLRDAGFNIAMAIVDGLTGGLASKGADMVREAAEALADKLPGWMKKVLGISSPSKVTHKIGEQTAEGFAKGIIDNIKLAVAAAVQMANAVIAVGDAAVAQVQKKASSAQTKAFSADSKADIKEQQARQAAKDAAEYAKKHKADKEGIKQREKAAAALQKEAEKARKEADAAQAAADKADERVSDVEEFQNADATGRGDIKNQRAVELAERANQMLAKANAEAAEAKRLMKTSKKAGQDMLKQAQKDAKAARALAAQAQAAHRQANAYYQQEVAARLRSMQEAAAQYAADVEFDAASDAQQAEILTERARVNDAKAAAAQKKSDDLLAQARKLAKTDAAAALRLIAQAEALADDAREAASQARQERAEVDRIRNQMADEAERAAEEAAAAAAQAAEEAADQAAESAAAAEAANASSNIDSSPSTPDDDAPAGNPPPGSGNVIAPSRSILEDAASTMDRYTASLQKASELAAAQAGVIQFVQNNNSPEALSASEIYRQSRNLLSAAEIKMGANSNTTS